MILIEILKQETKTLLSQYLEQTEIWAVKEFSKISNTSQSSIMEEFGYFEAKYSKKFQHTKTSFARWNKIAKIKSKGVDSFINKAIVDANKHYESSILKLASKIEEKGLIIDKLTVKSSHIGQNIDIVLTDTIKTVKAFTIVASGEIQKPHYRYLVK